MYFQNGLYNALPSLANLILSVILGYLSDWVLSKKYFSKPTTAKIWQTIGQCFLNSAQKLFQITELYIVFKLSDFWKKHTDFALEGTEMEFLILNHLKLRSTELSKVLVLWLQLLDPWDFLHKMLKFVFQ